MIFGVTGKYYFNGIENLLHGKLNITDTLISGVVSDTASSVLKHDIEGKVIFREDKIILEYIKRPCETTICDLFFRLQKLSKNRELSGVYEGFWSHPGIFNEENPNRKAYLTLDLI